MVTIYFPEEEYYSWLLSVLTPLFEKLGLESLVFICHSSYIYFFVILVVLAGIVAAVTWKLCRKKKRSSTRIQNPGEEILQDFVQETEDAEVKMPDTAGNPRILAAVHQHIGTRKDQQDSYGVSEPDNYLDRGLIAVVSDGMGGLANGRMVSSFLVRSLINGFMKRESQMNNADFLLEQAMIANSGVNQMLQGQDRSGSTLVSCVIQNGVLHFLTVGDSRLYLYRGGALIQLNREHIYQEELALNAVNQRNSLQQVRSDRQSHALTSYFGIGRMPYLDRNDEGIRLMDGDKILLASDGVFGTLSQVQMEDALSQNVYSAVKTLGKMILAANRTHQDNNTAVVLEYRA